MICGAVSGHQAPGLLHALGVHAHGRADRAVRLGDRGITQLARPATLADPVLCRAHRPVGRADPGVALEPDHVVEAQLAEEVEQLGVGEAGQDGDPDAGGQHLGQPTQAGILIVVAGIRQLILEHAEPDQRRRPAVPGHQLERQGGLPVGVEVGPVHRHDEVGAGPDQFRNPSGEEIPGLELAIAQQPVDLLDGVLGQKAARLGQGFADDRDAQRGPGHHPKSGIRQGINPLGMNILIKNTVEKASDILEFQEAALLSVDHIALQGRLC
jgi:hypothetical protein